MRSILTLAGTILVAGLLLFLNSHPLAAQAIGSNVTCTYCEDYADQVALTGEIRTDWRVGFGYVAKGDRLVPTSDTRPDAGIFEISCPYCEDYTDKAQAESEIRTDWHVGIGFAADRTERVAAKE